MRAALCSVRLTAAIARGEQIHQVGQTAQAELLLLDLLELIEVEHRPMRTDAEAQLATEAGELLEHRLVKRGFEPLGPARQRKRLGLRVILDTNRRERDVEHGHLGVARCLLLEVEQRTERM